MSIQVGKKDVNDVLMKIDGQLQTIGEIYVIVNGQMSCVYAKQQPLHTLMYVLSSDDQNQTFNLLVDGQLSDTATTTVVREEMMDTELSCHLPVSDINVKIIGGTLDWNTYVPCDSSTGVELTFQPDGTYSYEFQVQQVTLSVAAQWDASSTPGTVKVNGTPYTSDQLIDGVQLQFDIGTVVTVEAIGETVVQFVGWTDGTPAQSPYSSTRQFTMLTDTSLTAKFRQNYS